MSEFFPTVRFAPRSVLRALWRAARWFGRGVRRRARALVYLVLVLLVVHLTATLITGRMLAREIARQRAAGYIVSIDDLIPRVPAGEKNAADLYQKAFDALRLSKEDENELFENPFDQWDAKRLALARRVIAANAEYYRLLEGAARTPHCAFPVNWHGWPWAISFAHLAKLRQAARMLQARNGLAVHDDHPDQALADCGAMLGMAQHAKMEPSLISQLVAYALQGIALQTLERALSAGTPSPQACQRLFDQIAAIDQIAPSIRAMKGEVALCGLATFESLLRRRSDRDMRDLAEAVGQSGSRWPILALRSYGSVGRPIAYLDELAYLRAMKRNLDAFGLPWPQSKRAIEDMENGVKRLPTYGSILTKMITPVFSRAVLSRDRATASLGDAQIALALKTHRSDRGGYPDSLAALERAGFKLPNDPFGGKTYHYRREGAGFIVYSIGPNLKDDGGKPWDRAAKSLEDGSYDLPIRCSH